MSGSMTGSGGSSDTGAGTSSDSSPSVLNTCSTTSSTWHTEKHGRHDHRSPALTIEIIIHYDIIW